MATHLDKMGASQWYIANIVDCKPPARCFSNAKRPSLQPKSFTLTRGYYATARPTPTLVNPFAHLHRHALFNYEYNERF